MTTYITTVLARPLQSQSAWSVHQLGAAQVFKIYQSKKPDYHYARLFNILQSTQNHAAVRSQNNLHTIYQGAKMWSALTMSIKNSGNVEQFSRRCKAWIRSNIRVKP